MTTSNMVAVRVYRQDDLEKEWKDIPVACYMPTMLAGSHNEDNIAKRLYFLYLKDDQSILRLRWNYYGNDSEGFWVDNH